MEKSPPLLQLLSLPWERHALRVCQGQAITAATDGGSHSRQPVQYTFCMMACNTFRGLSVMVFKDGGIDDWAMRILYVCPWAHRAGHYPQAAAQETGALAKAGAHVCLYTFRGLLGDRVRDGVDHQEAVSTRIGFLAGILSRMLTVSTAARLAAQYIEFLVTLLLAAHWRKRQGYDVVYVRDGDPFLFVPILMGLCSKHGRWVVSLVGVMGKRSYAGWPQRLLCAPFWRPLYRRSLSRNQYRFVCQNRHTGDFFEGSFLKGLLSGRIATIPKGVSRPDARIPAAEARQHLDLPADKLILLHFGALHPGKDLATVLEAVKGIPDAVLVHAGALTSSVDLVGLAHRFGIANRVIVKDYHVAEAEKARYFWAADAVVLSYRRDFMQLPATLWEAATFAVPAIGSDVGELGELVRRYEIGLLFEPENAASVANALSAFVGLAASERAAMAGNCERFCDDFSLDTWAYRSLAAIRELCVAQRDVQ